MTRRATRMAPDRFHRRAVAYARVSSAEQEREGFSIPAQLRLLRDYARDHQMTVVEEFVDVETAKRSGRTGFGQMLKLLRRSRNDSPVILVEKTDRLYRTLKDWVTLDELDVDIHFVKEGTILSPDSRSADKFMHGIRVLMAKNYIDNLAEEVRKGMAEKAAQGIWPSRAPLGYRNVTTAAGQRTIEPDPETAPLIRQLFEWYAEGRYSLQTVTRMARDAGLCHRTSGTTVPKATIHRVLTNPLFQGDVVWDGRRFRGVHTPIVSRELFEQVQEVLAGRPGKRSHTRRNFAFAGLLTCAHCGCSLTAEIKKGRYVYYHCTGYHGKCKEPYVREEVLEELLAELLGLLRLDPEILAWISDALCNSQREIGRLHDEAIKRLEIDRAKLQRRLDAMYVDKLDGRIDASTYDRLASQWSVEQERLTDAIDAHRDASQVYFAEGAKLLELASRSQELFQRQPPQEKRKLLDFVLSNCLWGNGELTPTFRQPFDLLMRARKEADDEGTIAETACGYVDKYVKWYPQRDSNPRSPP